ncbi:Solute carrier 49 member 4 [Phlyctochytrium bullatum]|nr:Solute carrier 49 member 4 [Phlyctochytrium bullatum]
MHIAALHSNDEDTRSPRGGADHRSVSFADHEDDAVDGGPGGNMAAFDDDDDDAASSWSSGSSISMSATSHAWIQDLVRLSRDLPRWRARLFLVRRIGNNVPSRNINIFAMAITFTALPSDVKERLFDLGIRTHLDLVNLIITARAMFAFFLATLVISVVLICAFTMADVVRASSPVLSFLFFLDCFCIVVFTFEIFLHINAIPSRRHLQAVNESRSSRAQQRNPHPAHSWFILLVRPRLKQAAARHATKTVADAMGTPSSAPINQPDKDDTLLHIEDTVASPDAHPAASPTHLSPNLTTHLPQPHVIAAMRAQDMIKHHSLADPGWYWLAFDCLATVPFYVELAYTVNLARMEGKDFDGFMRILYGFSGLPPALWILRLFRVFRVIVVLEKSDKMKVMTRAFIHSMDGIWLLLILIPTLVVLFSFAIFFAEHTGSYLDSNGEWRYRVDDERSPFQSVPDTFWFVIVTLTTIGYGDVTPRTVVGRLVAAVVMFVSIFVIAFPLSMITMQYAHVVRTVADRARRQEELTYRMHHRLITQGQFIGSGSAPASFYGGADVASGVAIAEGVPALVVYTPVPDGAAVKAKGDGGDAEVKAIKGPGETNTTTTATTADGTASGTGGSTRSASPPENGTGTPAPGTNAGPGTSDTWIVAARGSDATLTDPPATPATPAASAAAVVPVLAVIAASEPASPASPVLRRTVLGGTTAPTHMSGSPEPADDEGAGLGMPTAHGVSYASFQPPAAAGSNSSSASSSSSSSAGPAGEVLAAGGGAGYEGDGSEEDLEEPDHDADGVGWAERPRKLVHAFTAPPDVEHERRGLALHRHGEDAAHSRPPSSGMRRRKGRVDEDVELGGGYLDARDGSVPYLAVSGPSSEEDGGRPSDDGGEGGYDGGDERRGGEDGAVPDEGVGGEEDAEAVGRGSSSSMSSNALNGEERTASGARLKMLGKFPTAPNLLGSKWSFGGLFGGGDAWSGGEGADDSGVYSIRGRPPVKPSSAGGDGGDVSDHTVTAASAASAGAGAPPGDVFNLRRPANRLQHLIPHRNSTMDTTTSSGSLTRASSGLVPRSSSPANDVTRSATPPPGIPLHSTSRSQTMGSYSASGTTPPPHGTSIQSGHHSKKRHHHSHHHHSTNSLSVREVERAFETVRDHDNVPVVHIRVADWKAEYREDRREDVLHMRLRVKDEDQYRRLMRMLQEFQ